VSSAAFASPLSARPAGEYDSGPYPYIRWRVTEVEQNRPGRY